MPFWIEFFAFGQIANNLGYFEDKLNLLAYRKAVEKLIAGAMSQREIGWRVHSAVGESQPVLDRFVTIKSLTAHTAHIAVALLQYCAKIVLSLRA